MKKNSYMHFKVDSETAEQIQRVASALKLEKAKICRAILNDGLKKISADLIGAKEINYCLISRNGKEFLFREEVIQK